MDSSTRQMTASDEAVSALQRIVVETLVPGDQLPAESDIAERIGVSRLTVREAVKVLEGRGLVRVARGRRAVVRPTQSQILSDYLAVALRRDPRGFLELTTVRRSLEVLSVGEAARLASDAALTAIEAALARMVAAAEALGEATEGPLLDEYHRSDLEFHAAVALASGNRMLELILDSLASCLRESFAASARGHFARGGTIDEDVRAHQAVCSAIRARDPIRAQYEMSVHLDHADRDLRAAMHLDPTTSEPSRATRSNQER